MSRYRLLIVNAILLLTVMASAWGRRIDNAVVSSADFLKTIPLSFREWKPEDISLPREEMKMLRPDSVLIRRYKSGEKSGQFAELAVIAGHRKETIHTPGFCMVGGGWEKIVDSHHQIPLPEGRVPAIRTIMQKDGIQLITTYFFSDGTHSTSSLMGFTGTQLLKRFRSEVPLGALVRIIVPVVSTRQQAERLSDEFAAATVPKVLKSLRETRLKVI